MLDTKAYLKVSAINFVFLMLGVGIGVIATRPPSSVVHAQSKAETGQEFEDISPLISAGNAAFGTLLAGRFAADQITIQGLDLLAFDQNLINLLIAKEFAKHSEIEALINKSRPPKILRMKPPEPPKPETQKEGKQK